MADESLTIDVSTNASSATPDIEALAAALQRILSGGTSAAEGLNQTETSAKRASNEVKKVEESSLNAGKAMTELGEAGRLLGGGLGEAFGRAGELAEGLSRLSEVGSKLGAIAPAIIGIGLAAGIAVGAVIAIKDSIEEAADMQGALDQLGANVAAQGQSWADASEGVEQFVHAESIATGVAGGELVAALNRAVSAGISLHDAEKLVAVSEDAHAATGKSVAEVMNALIAAELGRARGLEQMDPKLKTIIDHNGTLRQALEQMERQYGGAVAAEKGANAEHERMAAVIAQASETIGNLFLPMLKGLDESLIGLTLNVEHFGNAIKLWFGSSVDEVKNLASAFYDFFKIGVDIINHNPAQAKNDYANYMKATAQATKDSTTATKNFKNALDDLFKNSYSTGNDSVAAALREHGKEVHNLGDLDANPTLGDKKQKTNPGINEAARLQVGDMDAVNAAWQRYEEIMGRGQDAETRAKVQVESLNLAIKAQAQAVADATTVAAKHVEQKKLIALQDQANTQTTGLYTAAEKNANSAVAASAESYEKIHSKYQQAEAALISYQNKVKASKDETAGDKTELDKLAHSVEVARREDEIHLAVLAKKMELLARLRKDLKDATEATNSYKDAVTAANAASQIALEQDISKQVRDNAAQAATLGKSDAVAQSYYQNLLTQDYNYWQQLLAVDDEGAAAQERLVQEDLDKLNDLHRKAAEDQLKAEQELQAQLLETRKKAFEETKKEYEQFFNDILVKGENFGTSLKKAFQTLGADLQKQYGLGTILTNTPLFKNIAGGNGVDETQKQLTLGVKLNTDVTKENTTALGAHKDVINSSIQAQQTLTNSTNTLVSSNATLNTTIQQLIQQSKQSNSGSGSGQGSGQGGGSSTDSSFGAASVASFLADSSSQFDKGWTTPGNIGYQALTVPNPGSLSTLPDIFNQGNISSRDSWVNQSFSDVLTGLTGSSSGVSPSSQTAKNNAASGGPNTKNTTGSDIAGGQELLSGLLPGGTFSQTLGGAGEVVGGIFGGSLGASIGQTLGTIIGGLFGPHETQADQPDIYQPGYGQFVANYTGSQFGANGTNYNPELANWTGAGGTSIASEFSNFTNQYKNASGLDPAMQQLLQQIEALGPNADISSERQGVFTLADGSTVGVTQLEQLVSKFNELTNNNSLTPVFNVHGTAPNFMSNTTVQQIGAYSNTTGVYNPVGAAATGATASVATASPQSVNININLQNAVIANDASMDTLAFKISQSLKQFNFQNRFNSNINGRATV